MYINLATPATLRDNVLEWVDLDLDYRVHLDHTVELLDEVDFAENTARFAYPPGLVAQVRAACREIEVLLAERAFPFDYERQVKRYHTLRGR
jgi:protein associated with RNAse G/E